MANATRDNKNKIDYTLLPVKALEEEARVWMMGEKKYGRDNWLKLWGDDTDKVVMASLLRHAFKILEGEQCDTESGLSHAAHIRCNAAMLIQQYSKLEDEKIEKPKKAGYEQSFYGGGTLTWGK